MDPSHWQRALELFDQVSDLAPEERELRLHLVRDTDARLHASVQSLLRAHDSENGFLEREISSYAREVAANSAPQRIGAYRVLSEIGRGGMATVYLAERDDQQYRGRAAIKLVHSGSPSHADLKRRFLAERQILASLRHPNVAQLLDGGMTDDGLPYLVMEYVEGLRLDEYCRRGGLAIRERIELFRNVCSAVRFAHRNLIVHRDLKPSNILVTADGQPKLLDFGIAKLLGPEAAMQTALTGPAQRLMTLEYASPEQLRGEEVTTAADIYSLGVLLYELLAGVHPLEAIRGEPLALQRAICETEPPPPSAAARQANPALAATLSGDLDAIVLKAIRKEPAARYESVEQLSQDLERYLDGYPVEARQGRTRYRMRKFIRRHRWGVFAAAAFLALLIAFSTGAAMLAAKVTRERNDAQQQRVRAEKVSAFLDSMFVSADPNRNGGAALSARDLLDQGAARVAKELAAEPQAQVDLLETIGQAYKHLGLVDKADEIFREKVDAVSRGYGPQSEEMGRILRQLGDTERQRGRLAEAEADLRQSLAILEKLPPGRDSQLSHALNNMALVLQAKRDLPGAEADFNRAIAISARYPAETAERLTMQSNLGLVLVDERRYAEAEEMFRDVLAQRRKVLGEKHPQVANTIRHVATTLSARGKVREAEALLREVVEKNKTELPPDHPNAILTQVLLAAALRDEGRLSEAEAAYREAIAADMRSIGPHRATANHLSALAFVLFLEDDAAAAKRELERALSIVQGDGNSGTLGEARVLTQLGTVNTALLRYDAAAGNLERALAICERRPQSSQPETAAALFQTAELQQLRGDIDGARASYARSLVIDQARDTGSEYSAATHLLGYAAFLVRNNEGAEAEKSARKAIATERDTFAADGWQLDVANSILAATLAGQGRTQDAKPLAAAAYQNLERKLGPKARPTRAAGLRAAVLSGVGASSVKDSRGLLCCGY